MDRDDGTVIPLLVLGFLLAGTLLTAAVAGSAALVAHRRLAADCDGAALAGASALDRTALDSALSATEDPAAATDPPARENGRDRTGPGSTGGPGAAGDLVADADPAAGNPAGTLPAAGNGGAARGLPLDPGAAARSVAAYLATAAPGTTATVSTGRTVVTVVCARTVRVPFEAVIARPHGIRETATARASTVTRPST